MTAEGPATAASEAGGAPLIQGVTVELGPRSYEVLVGEGLVAAAGHHLRPLLRQPRVVIVSDDVVAPLYLSTLEESLTGAGIEHHAVVVPAGELSKDFAHLQDLIDRLLAARVERSTTLVALGGGMIGDLAGLAASIVLRGLDLVQVPTTLVAQVDSSVGGKTGINTDHGKNLIGTFHQPRLVLADIAVLDSLPERQFLAGYAETLKYGLIGDVGFFAWLEANGAALVAGDRDARRYAVSTGVAAKAAIVAADEREAEGRALLNLGHTFAHALEVEAGFGDHLLHGEAVAAGMGLAFDLSVRLGLCPPADAQRVRRHLGERGLPTGLGRFADSSWSADGLIAHMAADKKVRDGRPVFVLARRIGEAFIAREVGLDDVAAVLDDSLRA